MSNYLSNPYEQNKPPQDENFPLLLKTMEMRQGKYDANKAKAEQTLAFYGENLKGLRDGDNQYIAAKLNDLSTTIKEAGDLSLSSNSDAVMTRIGAVAKDPIVQSAILNRVKMDNFNSGVQKIREKNDGKYNDANYQDALTMAGVEDYMSGKTKTIGNLQYQNYVDVIGNFNKKAEEYTKARGLKEEYLGKEEGTYQTIDKYGVVVTEKEIQNYLYANVDDMTKAQMQINARATYKNVTPSEYNIQRASEVTQETTQMKLDLATNKAILKGMSKEEATKYADMIVQTEEAIKENEKKISAGIFSKDDIYKSYANNTIKTIAANYDIDIITKREKNNLPFEIIKFEAETALKERDLQLKQKANQIAQGAGLGTATERPTTTPEQEQSAMTKVASETYRADAGLDSYLKNTDPEYAKMNPNEQWNYKLSLNADNPVVKGANAELKNLIDSFKSAQSSYAKIVQTANTKIQETVRTNYNTLIGSKDLNLENLSTTMPLTVNLLKSNKSFDTLSKEEQIALTSEFAANNLQYNDNLSGDVRKVYEKVVVSNKALLSKIKTSKSQEVQKIIAKSTDTEEVGGYWSNWVSNMTGGINNVLGVPLNIAVREISRPINKLFQGEDYANAQYEDWKKSEKAMNRYSDTSKERFSKMNTDYFGGQDTNITEIEQMDTKKGKDIKSNFDAMNRDLATTITTMSDSFLPNLKDNKAFTFSTADKAQAPIAIAIRAAVLNSSESPEIPAGTNDYTIAREGEGFRISYLNKKGDGLASTYVTKLPTNVVNVFDTSIQNWNNNPMNPNINLKPVDLKAYTSPVTRDKEIKNLLENIPLSREVRIKLKTDPSNTAFATVPEYRDAVQNTYGKAFYETNINKIEEILTTTYKAVPIIEDGMFYMSIVYEEDGETKTEYIPNPIGVEKDDHIFNLKYREAVAALRDKKIASLNTK